MPVTSWSTAPSSNNAAPPNGWPEGMAAAAVNDTARQMMADLVVEFQKNQVKVLGTVAGTNTITAVMTPTLGAYSAGMMVVFTPAITNTGATTLNIDSLGALDVQKGNAAALVSGDLVAGIPALLVLDTGADDWILLNPQTINGVGATLSGNASVGGTLSVTGAVTLNGALTTDNSTADEVGFKGIPQQAQSGSYTAVLTDASKCITRTSGGAATWTIPANSSVAYPAGTVLTFLNLSATSVSIAITSDTMYLAGAGSTGTRTLAQYGFATAYKFGGTEWVISGTGLS